MRMKRLAAILLAALCALMPLSVLAGVYINNPDPADRLHLRSYPSTQAPSLGKYYNGAPITALEDNGKGWVRVRVGLAPGSLIGWM